MNPFRREARHGRGGSAAPPQATEASPLPRLVAYALHHRQACALGLRRLLRTPLAGLMTVGVLGVALALPTGLYTLLSGVRAWSPVVDTHAQVSLYLKLHTPDARAADLVRRLQQEAGVLSARYLSPDEGMKEFAAAAGVADGVGLLRENPLPGVIVVRLQPSLRTAEAVQRFADTVKVWPEVDRAQLDLKWVQRWYDVIELVQRAVLVLSVFLCAGGLLIIGNTLRLTAQRYQNEMDILRLVGATEGYVRRPFLYHGIWCGALGGIVACGLVVGMGVWLAAPLRDFATSYLGAGGVPGIGAMVPWQAGAALPVAGAVLGGVAALCSVSTRQRWAS